jgi:hypothetical protein
MRRPSQHPDISLTETRTWPSLVRMPGQVLTKRRAVDLCRMATCLCRMPCASCTHLPRAVARTRAASMPALVRSLS